MPRTLSTASDDSDTADSEEDVLYIEITLRRAVSGEQLGHPQVINNARSRNRVMSLGSLMVMGRDYEEYRNNVYSYFFEIDDGERRTVDCAAHVYDKVIDYVDCLEPIPIDPDHRLTTLRTQDRLHRLSLQQYEAEAGGASAESLSPRLLG